MVKNLPTLIRHRLSGLYISRIVMKYIVICEGSSQVAIEAGSHDYGKDLLCMQ